MAARLRYLLLQVRDADDPMREHEVRCFCRALGAEREQFEIVDLLTHCPSVRELNAIDMVVLGGSGDYSVARPGSWIHPALDAMCELHDFAKPTFAACWGFQAMSLALGGTVVRDQLRGEIGTHPITLTDAGEKDDIFGVLPSPVDVQMGHEDIVDVLPNDAVLLASTLKTTNQAFTFDSKPIYCTQFHPELTRDSLIDRLRQYPKYAEQLDGRPFEQLVAAMRPTPDAERLLSRFVEKVFGS